MTFWHHHYARLQSDNFGLSLTDYRALAALGNSADELGYTAVSIAWLANSIRMNRATFSTAVRRLLKAGAIHAVGNLSRGNVSTTYRMLLTSDAAELAVRAAWRDPQSPFNGPPGSPSPGATVDASPSPGATVREDSPSPGATVNASPSPGATVDGPLPIEASHRPPEIAPPSPGATVSEDSPSPGATPPSPGATQLNQLNLNHESERSPIVETIANSLEGVRQRWAASRRAAAAPVSRETSATGIEGDAADAAACRDWLARNKVRS